METNHDNNSVAVPSPLNHATTTAWRLVHAGFVAERDREAVTTILKEALDAVEFSAKQCAITTLQTCLGKVEALAQQLTTIHHTR